MKNEALRKLKPCSDGLEYAESFPSLQAAWDACERGDYLLWLLGKTSGPVGSKSRKKLVLAACACARLALKYVPKGEKRPLAAIEAAEDYARGGKTTLDEVSAAAASAAAASDAAYAASSASAAAAASSADAAAAASAASAAARKETLQKCADIVRKLYPKAPSLRKKKELEDGM